MKLPSQTQLMLPLLEALRDAGGDARPCHLYDANRGGSIPPSLIISAPNGSREQLYWKAERARGGAPHPAIMPAAVAEFGIKLATDEHDLVFDPMAGKFTVPAIAESLNRYAIGADRSLKYVENGATFYRSMGLPIREVCA